MQCLFTVSIVIVLSCKQRLIDSTKESRSSSSRGTSKRALLMAGKRWSPPSESCTYNVFIKSQFISMPIPLHNGKRRETVYVHLYVWLIYEMRFLRMRSVIAILIRWDTLVGSFYSITLRFFLGCFPFFKKFSLDSISMSIADARSLAALPSAATQSLSVWRSFFKIFCFTVRCHLCKTYAIVLPVKCKDNLLNVRIICCRHYFKLLNIISWAHWRGLNTYVWYLSKYNTSIMGNFCILWNCVMWLVRVRG